MPEETIFGKINRFFQKKFSEYPKEKAYNWEYLYLYGDITAAAVVSTLFVPEIVLVDGFALLIRDGDSIQAFKKSIDRARQEGHSLTDIVESFNMVEIPLLFHSNREPVGDVFHLVDEFVAEAWRARLAYLFPERRFKVVIEALDDTGIDTRIGFLEIGGPGT